MREQLISNGTLVMHTGFLMVVINHRFKNTYVHRELVEVSKKGEEKQYKEFEFSFEASYCFGQPMYLCRPLEWVSGKQKRDVFDDRFIYYQQADTLNKYDEDGPLFAFAAYQKNETDKIRDFWLFDDEFSVVMDKKKPLTYDYYLSKIRPIPQPTLF